MAKRAPDREWLDSLGARVLDVRGHHPLILDDPHKLYLIRSGTAAVFASRLQNGLPVGTRRFLFHAGVHGMLFAASGRESSRDSQYLMALSVDDLDVVEIPLDPSGRVTDSVDIDMVFDAFDVALKDAIDDWVAKLSASAAVDIPSGTDKGSLEEGDNELAAGSLAGIWNEPVMWTQLKSGQCHTFGDPELEIRPHSEFMPLGRRVWMRTTADTVIRAYRSPPDETAADLIHGLTAFNTLLQRRLQAMDDQDNQAERQRLHSAEARERKLLGSALANMAGVLNPKPVALEIDDALLNAATLVGRELDIEMRPPAPSEDMVRVPDPVEAIARASRCRFRMVLLAGEWWKDDCGPLLAYRADSHKPVALLKSGFRGYQFADPESGETGAVDEEFAGELEPKAIMFYRRLPEGIRNAWQIPRWALRGKYPDLVFIGLLSLTITLIGMLVPQATALIIDNAIPDANERLVTELGLALMAAAFGIALFSLAQGILSIRANIASDAVSQSAVWDRLLNLSLPVFRRFSSGDLLERAMAISEINRELNGQTMRSALTSLTALLNLGLLYYYNSKLAMMALGVGLVVALVTILAGIPIRRYYRRLMELRGRFFGLVVELVRAVSKIQVAGAQRRAFAVWVNRYSEQLEYLLRAQRVEDYIYVFNYTVPLASSILLFWLAASMLTGELGDDALTVGVFLAFNTALGTFVGGVTHLSGTVLEFMDTLAKAKRLEPLLEAEIEVDESAADPGQLRGKVSFSDVDFRYTEDGPKILDGVSFVAHPEEFIAFVGPSGSGKSTIFRLLLGFEEPEAGRVCFDGQDLESLDVTAVRRQFGVVLQTSRINAGSILESIGSGASVSLDETWEAAEDAGFADDIREMPMGMHTVVSEGGSNLSGGQRQRLLIARSLVSRPKILLFDEATSALDNRTQNIVSRSLERRKVTRIVIAHRLSTIRNANRIYVLDQGAVVESGTFDDLVNAQQLFASMMARQVA